MGTDNMYMSAFLAADKESILINLCNNFKLEKLIMSNKS
jgi:hypothetical protein